MIRPAIYSISVVTCIFLGAGILFAYAMLKLHSFFKYLGLYLLMISVVSSIYVFVYLPGFVHIVRELMIIQRLLGLAAGAFLVRMMVSIKNGIMPRKLEIAVYVLMAVLFAIGLIDLLANIQLLFRDPPPIIHVGALFKIVYVPFSVISLIGACVLVIRAAAVLTNDNRRLIKIVIIGMLVLLPFQCMDLVQLVVKDDPYNEALFLYNPALLFYIGCIYLLLIEYIRIQTRYSQKTSGPKMSNKQTVECDEDRMLYEKIAAKIQSESLYTNPELSVDDVAKSFGQNKNDISRIINIHTGTNFKKFINRYRVNQMKIMLEDPAITASILELANRCGFNSKTSLNRVFFNLEKMTPREYRNTHNPCYIDRSSCSCL